MEKEYIEFDKYYRKKLFNFYRNRYLDASLLAFREEKLYMSIMNHIQDIVRNKFCEFCENYCDLMDNFYEMNDFIIKLKII